MRTTGRPERQRKEATRYWTRDDLGGLECLWGRFVEHEYRPHSHPGYVIAVITQGVEAVNCRGTLHRAGPGDILFVNPEVIHDGQRGVEAGWQYRVFYPTVEAASALSNEGASSRAIPLFRDCVVHDPNLASRLGRCHEAIETATSAFRDQVTWTELLGDVLGRYATGNVMPLRSREPARIKRVREMIETSCDSALSLDRLADEVQVSAYHLIRLFKAETGVSPHAYLIAQRLRRAKALLDRRSSAAEAAVAAGFVDQSHFIRHFRAAYGMTPGQYTAARSARAPHHGNFVQSSSGTGV